MRKVLLYSLSLTLGILLCLPAMAQDINYTQYFSTPLYYNPAFTGLNTGLRARFTFRDQWPTLPVDIKSYYFSADIGDRNLPGAGGLGIMIQSDNPGYGLINNLQAALTLGVRVPVTSYMVIQVGVKAAVVQRLVNWDELVFSDQLDPKYGNIYQTGFIPPDADKRVFPDFAAGGILQFISPEGNINGNVGFAVDHLFRPDQAFLTNASAPLPRKYVAHGDVVIASGYSSSSFYRSADEPLKVNIGFIYQNQAKFNSLELGLNLLKFNIYLGGWYKTTMSGNTGTSIALLAGYRYMFAPDMSIKFIYSYDLQVSKSLAGTGGAHEISLVLEFDQLSLFGGGGGRGGGGFIPGGGGGRRGYSSMECPTFY
jgi:type IX secretion system PorP/SprF family membrane protein